MISDYLQSVHEEQHYNRWAIMHIATWDFFLIPNERCQVNIRFPKMKDLSNNIIITYWEVFLELAVCKLLSRARDGERSSDRGRPDPWGRGGRSEPLGRPGAARHDPWARNDREEQDRRRMDDVSRTTGEVCIKYISTTNSSMLF